jgi:glycosyltransferase involved in cell wall biosynthesis
VSGTQTAADFFATNPRVADAIRTLNKNVYLKYIEKLFDRKQPSLSKNDVRFIGYVESKLGLGTATRGTITCFRRSSSRYSIYPYSHGALDRYEAKFEPEKYDTYRRHKINVFELGLDHIDHAIAYVNGGYEVKSYNILKLYWELSEIPPEKIEALNFYDEVWAPSKFVHDAVAKVFKKKILIIPPYVDVSCRVHFERDRFGLSKEKFYFLFSFDYNSSIHRKNPFAVVRAFQAAFPPTDLSVGLVVKSNNPANSSVDPRLVAELKRIDERVVFVEDYFDRGTMLSLIASCDCYVSLHRSEGYGMGMAEAICLGRKVIATNYSGNIDFLNRYNSFPVDYKIVDVEADQYYLAAGQTWAEPIHESAVHQFRVAVRDRGPRASDLIEQQRLYRRSIPSKAHLAKMMSSRIRAIKEALRTN